MDDLGICPKSKYCQGWPPAAAPAAIASRSMRTLIALTLRAK
jgi:hypothetical protein